MPARFIGFGPDLFAFLKGLKANNHKAWFDANRDVFESAVKTPLGDLVESLAESFAKAKLAIQGNRKASLFRMNRDIRFSKDKSPYKTNAGAAMSSNGTKKCADVFYIHLEPGGSFLAAGFYMPEPPFLHALRSAVVNDSAAFRKLVKHLAKHDLAFDTEDSLKRLPKGFEEVTDADLAAAVRLKHFVVVRKLDDADVLAPDLPKVALAFAKASAPLIAFGNMV
jgi:uncharacterized protein (TIGR02453 family)